MKYVIVYAPDPVSGLVFFQRGLDGRYEGVPVFVHEDGTVGPRESERDPLIGVSIAYCDELPNENELAFLVNEAAKKRTEHWIRTAHDDLVAALGPKVKT